MRPKKSSTPYRVPSVRVKDRFNKVGLGEGDQQLHNPSSIDKVSSGRCYFNCVLGNIANAESRSCSSTTCWCSPLLKVYTPAATMRTPPNASIGRTPPTSGRPVCLEPMTARWPR
jgi:hypothetical protein